MIIARGTAPDLLLRKGMATDVISRAEMPWDVLHIARMTGLCRIIERRNAPGHRIAFRDGPDIILRVVAPRNVISRAGTASDVLLHIGTPQVILSRVGTASGVLYCSRRRPLAYDCAWGFPGTHYRARGRPSDILLHMRTP